MKYKYTVSFCCAETELDCFFVFVRKIPPVQLEPAIADELRTLMEFHTLSASQAPEAFGASAKERGDVQRSADGPVAAGFLSLANGILSFAVGSIVTQTTDAFVILQQGAGY